MRRSPRLVPALVLVAAFALWELAVHTLRIPPYLLPPPSMLAARIAEDWRLIADNSWVTLQEVLIGFGLAAAVSIPLAALLQRFRVLEEALYPLLVSSQTIPKVAIAPLLVVWFGFGAIPKILIAFLVCFFPILIDTLAGLQALRTRW